MTPRARLNRALLPIVLGAGAIWVGALAATFVLYPHRVQPGCGYHYVRRTPWWVWITVFGASSFVWGMVAWVRRVEPFRTERTSVMSWATGLLLAVSWLWFLISVVFFGLSSSNCVYGRPLRAGGRVHLPRVRRRGRRCRSRDRRAIGEHWLECARGELASVPAFERLATQLEQLAAPTDLIERAHACAREESVHAQRTAALATRTLGGLVALSLPELPAPPTVALTELAVESLLDGCLNEGCAAREAELRASATDLDPETAAVLAMIACDERAHAELAWSIIEWALDVDPAAVAPALHATTLPPPREGFRFPPGCDRALLRSFGWIEPDLCKAAHADVAAELHERLAALLVCVVSAL